MKMIPFLSTAELFDIDKLPVYFESDVILARNLGLFLAKELNFNKITSIRIGSTISELGQYSVKQLSDVEIGFHVAIRNNDTPGIILEFKYKDKSVADLSEIKKDNFRLKKKKKIGSIHLQRLMDDFHVQESKNEGIIVTAAKWLPKFSIT